MSDAYVRLKCLEIAARTTDELSKIVANAEIFRAYVNGFTPPELDQIIDAAEIARALKEIGVEFTLSGSAQ